MSMKDFDDFLGDIVSNGPRNEQPVYDERQGILRLKCALLAVSVTLALFIINSVVFIFYQWTDQFYATALFLIIGAVTYSVSAMLSGCFYAVNAHKGRDTFAMLVSLFIIFMYSIIPENEHFIFIENGMATRDFIRVICCVIIIVFAVFFFTWRSKDKKSDK